MSVSKLAVFLWVAGRLFAQEPLRFEVATIKPATPGAVRNRVMPSSSDRLVIPAMNVRWMIYTAYQQGMGTSWNVSGGPEWVDQTYYAIEGKASKPSTQRELRLMLRTLLAERFGLKVRQEARTGAPGSGGIYTLVLDRSDGKLGPNIQEWDGTCGGNPPSAATDADDPYVPRCQSGYFAGGLYVEGGTLLSAAELLSLPQSRQLLGTIVQDRTGLTGRYKLRLLFDFAAAAAASARPTDPTQAGFAGPSLFDAVREQWGLRLVRGEGPLNMVFVENVERPTEN